MGKKLIAREPGAKAVAVQGNLIAGLAKEIAEKVKKETDSVTEGLLVLQIAASLFRGNQMRLVESGFDDR
jgi:hypothetical protein